MPDETQQIPPEVQMMLQATAQLVAALAPPGAGVTVQTAWQPALQSLMEAEQLQPLFEGASASSEDAEAQHLWGVRLVKGSGPHVQVVAPKPLHCQNDQELAQSMVVLAFATSTIARTLARTLGYQIAFFQGGGPKNKSSLILPT